MWLFVAHRCVVCVFIHPCTMPSQYPPPCFPQRDQGNSLSRVPQRPSVGLAGRLSRTLPAKVTEGKWDIKPHCQVEFELYVLDIASQASRGFQVNKGSLFQSLLSVVSQLLSGLSSLFCFLFYSER